MGFSFDKIKDLQIDILKEVGNIGAGHAATALSTMIQKQIDMNVPNVKLIPFSEIEDFLGGEDKVVVGIFLRVEGDIPGNMFFVMTVDSAKQLLKRMMGDAVSSDPEFSEIEFSALHEVGNILAGSYLSSLADFTNLKLYPTVPSMAIDMVGAIISFGLLQVSQISDVAILINTTFLEGEHFIEGHFFLIPDPEAFDRLFSALGVPL
nr:chemotaxis protein CheC [Vulcanibacillus modesticaldus]